MPLGKQWLDVLPSFPLTQAFTLIQRLLPPFWAFDELSSSFPGAGEGSEISLQLRKALGADAWVIGAWELELLGCSGAIAECQERLLIFYECFKGFYIFFHANSGCVAGRGCGQGGFASVGLDLTRAWESVTVLKTRGFQVNWEG